MDSMSLTCSVARKAVIRKTDLRRNTGVFQASPTQTDGRFTSHPPGQSERFRACVAPARKTPGIPSLSRLVTKALALAEHVKLIEPMY